MKRRQQKTKLTFRSIGTMFVLFFTLILPMIGSAQRAVPLICVKTKRATEHDCAHCSAIKGSSSVSAKPTKNPSSHSGAATVPKVGESCCHPGKTSHKPSQAIESKPKSQKISSSAASCKCEMAPAETRPTVNGHLIPGYSFEPFALAPEFSVPDDSAAPVERQVFARVTRGPPPGVHRLGPPDRAPPAI